MYSHQVFGAVGATFCGLSYFVGVTIFEPPLVELMSVEYLPETQEVRYERRVNSPVIVRAPYHGDIVEVATEREVPECISDGRADYGPDEPSVQFFPFDVFLGPGCKDALVPGKTYVIWASVTPLTGEGSEIRSQPFVWSAK